MDLPVRLLTVVLLAGTAAYAVGPALQPLVGDVGVAAAPLRGVVAVAAAGLCLSAAVRERRWPALLAGWGLLALAHLVAAAVSARTGSPVAGAGAWPAAGYFPPALIALWLLLRDGLPRWMPSRWGDAAVVGLGALAGGTAATALARHDLLPGLPDQEAVHLAPLASFALLAAVLSVAALGGSRRAAACWWLATGLVLVAAADLARLLPPEHGAPPAGAADLCRLLGYAAVGVAARPAPWAPWAGSPPERRPRSRAALRLGALPWVAVAISAAVLAAAAVGGRLPGHSAVLALGCLCAALLRAGLTLGELDGGPLTAGATRIDELTGLANRRALSEALAGDGAAAGDGGTGQRWSGWTDRIALLLVDLDSFKDINEALGHGTGDRVLAEIGARLRGALHPPQLVARLGGDEFAVVLPDAGRDEAGQVARRLCRVMAEPVAVDGHRLHVRASVGVATCRIPGDPPEDLLRRADVALNRAKARGTALEVYDAARDQRSPRRLRRIDELRSALERGDLEVFLQPQVDLADGTVVGAEALARWRHPQDGVLLPDSFLPLAAQTGLMRPVAALVLDRAVEACAQWWRCGHRIPVSVNLTADDLRDPQITRRISEGLTLHGLPPHALRIEITEDLLLTDPQATAELLQSWRGAGIAVSVDDYGTGYSSLGYLRELPFDELKLDRSFVADLHRRTTLTIVRHTVALAHGLGMRVVAEGVEDAVTARQLADIGCDVAQGLYFGAATAVPAFLEQLAGGHPT